MKAIIQNIDTFVCRKCSSTAEDGARIGAFGLCKLCYFIEKKNNPTNYKTIWSTGYTPVYYFKRICACGRGMKRATDVCSVCTKAQNHASVLVPSVKPDPDIQVTLTLHTDIEKRLWRFLKQSAEVEFRTELSQLMFIISQHQQRSDTHDRNPV